jgi:hypothetical protein
MTIMLFCVIYAHASIPEILHHYPEQNVNLNQPATLLLIGNHLASPLTITIAEDTKFISDNSNPNRVSCIISARSTPGFVTLTVGNTDGTWTGHLNFVDCSSFVQIDETINRTDYSLTVNNLCYTRYTYQLDTSMEQDVEFAQITLSNLTEGPHQLTITGYDAAQNSCSERVSFTVDSIAPQIQVHNIPTKITSDNFATISVTTEDDDAAAYRYYLNNNFQGEHSFSEAIALTSLSLGTHSLLVYGCDINNNCQSTSEVAPITWTVLDIAFASNSALTTTQVLAGTQSGIYSTNCMENDVEFEWSVYNYEGKQMGETVSGNTFSFTPSKTGAYAGIYTVNMTAMYDNQTVSTLDAQIKVPFDIEANRYNIIEEAIISVKGVEPGANLIQDIKANEFSPTDLSDISDIGKWYRTDTESMQLTFKPSESVTTVTSFDVWISIENDLDLNESNNLFQQTTGPFFIIPYKNYTIELTDENGSISTTTNTDITIREMVTLTNQNLTASNSDVRFSLPASGGTYYFKIEDNREPPVFMPQTLITSDCDALPVLLQKVGTDVIEGSVQDEDDNYLENVIVTAYQPVDEASESLIDMLPAQYEAKTQSNGKYIIYLPTLSAIGGWTVIAGKEGYVSAIKTDQMVNSEDVSFSGSDALQLETQIEEVWLENGKINIQADPDFSYPGEIDIRIITKENEYYAQEHELENKTIGLANPTSEEYTLIIFADTRDNHDPKTGNYTRHAYRKNSTENVIARIDRTMNVSGGSFYLDNNSRKAKVEIPVNGITETATITIEQIEKVSACNATTGTQYIYGIHATSVNTGHSLTDDQINQVAITLPFDFRTIHPGDIENDVFHVYRADTLEMLENHQTELIYNIRKSDYRGDGKVGSITVLVDQLSYFAIGIPPEVKASDNDQSLKKDEGGDCFIGILH